MLLGLSVAGAGVGFGVLTSLVVGVGLFFLVGDNLAGWQGRASQGGRKRRRQDDMGRLPTHEVSPCFSVGGVR